MGGCSVTRNPRSPSPIIGEYASQVIDVQVLMFVRISGDFGDFASFVAHMKEIAIVRHSILSLAAF